MRLIVTTALNVLLLILALLTTLNPSLLSWGTIDPVKFWQGEIYRVITAMWLHVNWVHALVNVLLLYFIGNWIEARIGHKNTLILFILGGIGGNLCHVVFESSRGLGASGGIYALFVCAIMYQYKRAAPLFPLERTYFNLIVVLAITGIMLGLAVNLIPNLLIRAGNAAHIGGGLVGAVYGWWIGHRQTV
jgi:rhomboid protease GluP